MRLTINGSLLSSSHTNHIKAKYYFIKDKVDEGEVDIQYCPTDRMWSDLLNKSNQGMPFKRDRSVLMNVPVEYDDQAEFFRTHPYLLPEYDKTILGITGIDGSRIPSRIVLRDLSNKDSLGILRNHQESGKLKNRVTWADMASRKVRRTKI